MADFKKALLITMGNEGGYNHGVGENETFFGIDRGYNGSWPGWKLIDQIKTQNPGKKDSQLNGVFKSLPVLMDSKDHFYKTNYWDTLKLDLISDQQVANILFDDNVNPCEINAARVMQSAAVACGASLTVDGQVGNQTITAVNSINPKTYYSAVVIIREFHYKHEVVVNPKQVQWLHSWLGRLTPYQS